MLFCPLPWIHQAIRNNGDLRVCCQANQGPDRGVLRKQDGTIYNAEYDDLMEARNARKMKDIRVAMMNDKWHPDCIRCNREEANGIRSRFTYEKEVWQHYITEADAIRTTAPDGTIDTDEIPVIFYDLRFGNHCNLKCRSCGPTDSDSWYGDRVKVFGDTYYETSGPVKILKVDGRYKPEIDIYSWYKRKEFWDHLEREMHNIQQVYMLGGEPLLIDQHFDFLNDCIRLGYSQNITIEYNSNIMYIPDKAWDLWKKFKEIKVGASIDGIGKVNDYLRYPSKWSTIERNLHRFDNAEGNFKVWVAATVQALNILHMPDLFKWIIDQDFKRVKSIVSLHPLHSPDFLSVKVLPFKTKNEIANRLNFDNDPNDLLDRYCKFMFSEDHSQLLSRFWMYNNKLDEIRGQSMKESLPELYELIGDTNV